MAFNYFYGFAYPIFILDALADLSRSLAHLCVGNGLADHRCQRLGGQLVIGNRLGADTQLHNVSRSKELVGRIRRDHCDRRVESPRLMPHKAGYRRANRRR